MKHYVTDNDKILFTNGTGLPLSTLEPLFHDEIGNMRSIFDNVIPRDLNKNILSLSWNINNGEIESTYITDISKHKITTSKIELEFSDGNKFSCDTDTLIFCVRNNAPIWIPANNIYVGDTLFQLNTTLSQNPFNEFEEVLMINSNELSAYSSNYHITNGLISTISNINLIPDVEIDMYSITVSDYENIIFITGQNGRSIIVHTNEGGMDE